MTSLNSGLPSRETWVKGPWWLCPAPSPLEILARWRSAEVQTPIVWWPGLVTWEIGIWMAIVCTLSRLLALTPCASAILLNALRCWNGRRSPRSKIEPRST